MSRIVKAYETQFGWMLRHAGARRADEGVRRILDRAATRTRLEHVPLPTALTDAYERLATHPYYRTGRAENLPDRFFCDSGLGGLARWLRGAGYQADWLPYIHDDGLLRTVRENPAILLTTDSMLMERKLLRDRVIPSLWLPPIHSLGRQLELVFREFRLQVRSPRCMRCGGELQHASKEEMKDRIPPRTYRWIDEYFECRACGKLFWHGTHWKRIQQRLLNLQAG